MASSVPLGGSTTAFLICDMQNDFVHPDGAYGRAGQSAPAITDLVPRHRAVADAVRASGGWTVATLFTLVPGRGGEPWISDHLRDLRPFLAKGDFQPGGWGQAVIDDLQPVDLAVEKVAFSAFYMSRLEWVLARAGIDTLIVGGIVTNGGVASTLRDAHVRGYRTLLLTDGCAAFSDELHQATIRSLSSVAEPLTCAEAVERLAR
jgi:nicotinamidase-related amidase